MFRNVGAIVVGVITAFAAVMLVDRIGHMVYPPPTGLDFTDPDAIRPYLATLPVGAFLFILSTLLAMRLATVITDGKNHGSDPG